MALGIAALQITRRCRQSCALAKLRFRANGSPSGWCWRAAPSPAQITFVPVFTMLGSAGW
jgi:sn-glycerol 3-phosphate transport system permease protein